MTSIGSENRFTVEDVERVANVSCATVSRVINNKWCVSDATRARVIEALTRTGYVVNRQARGLAGGRSQVVGLVVSDLDTSYCGEIVRGIDEELAAVSYDLMLYTTHHRIHRESAFVGNLMNGLADGLLLLLPFDLAAYLDSFRKRRFPFVLIDTLWGIILPQVAFALPLSVLILRNFFVSITVELEDAAYVDGASAFEFFRWILLPLARPGLAAVAVLTMVTSWNNYFLPLVVLNSEKLWTLPLGVMQYQGQFGSDWGTILAFVSLAMVPAVIFYLFAERQIIAGLTAGAIKG